MCLLSSLPSATLVSQFCRLHVHYLDISIWCWGWSRVWMQAQAAWQSQSRAGAFPMSDNQESGMLGQWSPAELPVLSDSSLSKLSTTNCYVHLLGGCMSDGCTAYTCGGKKERKGLSKEQFQLQLKYICACTHTQAIVWHVSLFQRFSRGFINK